MRTRKALALAFVWAFCVVLVVHFVQFPGSVPDFTAVSGGGTLLDTVPAFTPLALHRIVRTLLLSLPFVYVIFDLLENSAVLVLLANYPERLDRLAASLAHVTMVKRVASLLALAAPLALWVSARLRTAKH